MLDVAERHLLRNYYSEEDGMNKLKMYVLLAASFSLLFLSCSKKNSDEACQHDTTMNLDKGNYDAVLTSGCADTMQRGAAYFGKAGYDMKNVLNRFVQTGSSSGQTSTKSDLTVYMTDLVVKVDEGSLNNLDNSTTQYYSISAASESYKDAQFDVSLVEMIKGLSLMKLIVSDISGTLNTSCDINTNTIADGADAASCALVAASRISSGTTTTCTDNTTYTPATPVDIHFPDKSGTYSGLVITLLGTATTTCPSQFNKLLYKDSATGKYWAVATDPDIQCKGSDNKSWPCPIEQNGKPLDLVNTIDSSLNSAVSSLNSALTATGGATTNVQTSIQDVQTQACPSGTCTSLDLANYLQTIQAF
jgi:hypothetical protein